MRDLFLAFLAQHDDGAWLRVVDRLEGAMHPVDRAATRIWFQIYPLALAEAMARPDAADLARRMTLAGRWQLADQIDTSHYFLHAHRYWPVVKQAVLDFADAPSGPGSLDLGAQVHEAAARAARSASTTADRVLGLTAIGLRTLQQVGADALAASPAPPAARDLLDGLTPDDVLDRRRRAGGPRLLNVLRGARKQWTVTFDERRAGAHFPLVHSQHVATAAALDTRDYRSIDARCSEGPIPVQCRSCSCGTCWVGLLSGAANLSPLAGNERQKLLECGVTADGTHPVVRLACQAQAFGPVTIVIPPWNGLIGRVLSPAR